MEHDKEEIRSLKERHHELANELQGVISSVELMKMALRQIEKDLYEVRNENSECRKERVKLALAVNGLSMKVGFIVVVSIFIAEWAWKFIMR